MTPAILLCRLENRLENLFTLENRTTTRYNKETFR